MATGEPCGVRVHTTPGGRGVTYPGATSFVMDENLSLLVYEPSLSVNGAHRVAAMFAPGSWSRAALLGAEVEPEGSDLGG